ncbi:MAG: HAD family hydrolase [Candidatus Woesearchaeota archaeon]
MIICWDLNGTLEGYNQKRDYVVRPNITDVLKETSEQGIRNVITSTRDEHTIKDFLVRHSLDSYVDRCFGFCRSGRDSKSYAKVANHYGLTLDKAAESMIAIGDNEHDHPGDIDNMVFIYNPNGVETDARIVQQLATTLHGNVYERFQALKRGTINLKSECGFHYHGQLGFQDYTGIIMSAFNGGVLATPTILLIPEKEAKEQFEQLEVLL